MQAVRSLWNRGVAAGRLRAVPGAEFAVFGASVAVLLHAVLSLSQDLKGGQWNVVRRAIAIKSHDHRHRHTTGRGGAAPLAAESP